MRRGHGRRRWLLLLALLGLGAFEGTAVSGADEATVEPTETASGYAWKPSAVTATPGGTVAFRNPSEVTPHGLRWTGGPEKPRCVGVPVDSFGTSWNGTCSFTQAGTYTFVCTVHPEEMKGTITVASDEASAPPAHAPGQPPAGGPESQAVESLQLAGNQRGETVRGAIVVSSVAVGGNLSVEIRAPRKVLGKPGKGTLRVGELRRSIAGAGRLPFAVHLRPVAQAALQRRGHLPLLVTMTVDSPGGVATAMTRRVKLSD